MIGITERGDAALDHGWEGWVTEGKPAVLITKSPSRLLEFLSGRPLYNIIIHCTITGYGGTEFEPNVKPWGEEIQAFHSLCDLYGTERVVLRVDPIIPFTGLVDRAWEVLGSVVGRNSIRVRISFLDAYIHVRERFRKIGVSLPWGGVHAPLDWRRNALRYIKTVHGITPEVCGEPGFVCTGCISERDCKVFGVHPGVGVSSQRIACRCLSLKHELLRYRKPCAHQCLYCYWKG